jgi:transcriptional regulator with XRE-family HTH domain
MATEWLILSHSHNTQPIVACSKHYEKQSTWSQPTWLCYILSKTIQGEAMNIEIANRLVELRRSKGLSQEELAEKIGISRQAVSKWERAESSPDTDNLIQLAKLYDLTLDELLFGKTKDSDTKNESHNNSFQNSMEETILNFTENILETVAEDIENTIEDGLSVIELDDDFYAFSFIHLFYSFPVTVFVTITYLALGIIMGLWHPWWLLFMIIPIYSGLIKMFHAKGIRKKLKKFPFSTICTTAFLVMGFVWELWHPGWVVFLLIPVYDSLVSSYMRSYKHYRKQ